MYIYNYICIMIWMHVDPMREEKRGSQVGYANRDEWTERIASVSRQRSRRGTHEPFFPPK
jgi:hypothetical protein